MTQLSITLIGCGKMGASMIHGWLGANLIKHAEILDPNEIDDSLSSHTDLFHVKLMESLSLAKTDIIILAVKPQIMDDVCAELSKILPAGIPVISIAAGTSTAYFEKQFSKDTPIIRTMPNLPAIVGQGITALYASDTVSKNHKDIASSLLNAVGETIWLDDESQMDAVTALSGSGPAYVFYMIEVMAQAGEKAGLSKEQAVKLARQTVIGAAALAKVDHDTPAPILRQNVTSKGGTTEAALKILMDGKFQNIMDETIQAANQRGKELDSKN